MLGLGLVFADFSVFARNVDLITWSIDLADINLRQFRCSHSGLPRLERAASLGEGHVARNPITDLWRHHGDGLDHSHVRRSADLAGRAI